MFLKTSRTAADVTTVADERVFRCAAFLEDSFLIRLEKVPINASLAAPNDWLHRLHHPSDSRSGSKSSLSAFNQSHAPLRAKREISGSENTIKNPNGPLNFIMCEESSAGVDA